MSHLGCLFVAAVVLAQNPVDGKKAEAVEQAASEHPVLKSGGKLPGSFAPYNLSGDFTGRYHCLVCQYKLNPTVLVFARDQQGANTEQLDALLAGLDKAVVRHADLFLKSFVVFLSPDARDSITDPDVKEPEVLIKEAEARQALLKRLKERAKGINNVVVTSYKNAGPEGYQIDPNSEVVVLIYKSYNLLANPYIFEAGELTDQDVKEILQTVDEVVTKAAG